MDRYSEMEMTKIGKAEYKRGRKESKEEMLKDEIAFLEDLIKNIRIKSQYEIISIIEEELKDKIK